MTSATVGFRPSTTVSEIQLSGRTVTGQEATEVATEGQDSIPHDCALWPPAMPDWRLLRAGLDTGKSLMWPWHAATSVAASAPLTSRDFQITLDRLRGLEQDEDVEDRPSDYAYCRIVELLRELAGNLGMQFPRAIAVTGPSNGIRLLWSRNEREVRVTVGGSEANKSYLYWRDSGQSGIGTLNGQILHQRLRWLTEGM